MALEPGSEGRFQDWVGSTLQMVGKDLTHEVRGASSRGQKGRGCQLGCSSYAESSSPHRERCL